MNVRELKKKYKIMDILNYFELSNEEDGKKIEYGQFIFQILLLNIVIYI